MSAVKAASVKKRSNRRDSESTPTIPRLKFIPSMDPVLVDEPPEGAGWIHEIKYDGYRTQLIKDASAIRAMTRRGLDWTDKYQLIVGDAAPIEASSFIIDGEICVQDENGVTDFGAVRRAMSREPQRLVYSVFDLLHFDGEDLRPKPIEERRAKLRWLVQHLPGHIRMSDEYDGDGAAFFALADKLGLEGVVSKRKGSRYSSGYTRAWLKAKCWQTGVFDVIGVEMDQRGAPYALLADSEGYRGSAFVTLPTALREAFWRYIEAQGVPTAPIRGLGKKKATWVRPSLRARVRHLKGSCGTQPFKTCCWRKTMDEKRAEDLVVEAIAILQRNLPPGGVSDRNTISELWGLLDSPEASALYFAQHPEHLEPKRPRDVDSLN